MSEVLTDDAYAHSQRLGTRLADGLSEIVAAAGDGLDDAPVLAAERAVVQPRDAADGRRGAGGPRRAAPSADAGLPREPRRVGRHRRRRTRRARSPRPTTTSTSTWRRSADLMRELGLSGPRVGVPDAVATVAACPTSCASDRPGERRPGRRDRPQRIRRGPSLRLGGRAGAPTARWRGPWATRTSRCCRARATNPSRRWAWCGSASTCRPSCSPSPAPPTRASRSTSTAYAGSSPPPASSEADLQTPADYPLDDAAREAIIREGGTREPVLMNCSGKHAAMLATCVANGWPTESLPRRRAPAPAVDRGHLRRPHRRAHRGHRRRRLRRPALLGVTRGPGPRVPPARPRSRRLRGPRTPARDGSPRPSVPTRRTSRGPRATSAPCSRPSRARSGRQAPRAATPSRCADGRAFALKTDDGAARVRPGADGRGAPALRRPRRGRCRRGGGPAYRGGRDPRRWPAGRRDPGPPRLSVTSGASC